MNKVSELIGNRRHRDGKCEICNKYIAAAEAVERLVQAAREFYVRAGKHIYPSNKPGSDYEKLHALIEALKPFEDEA